MLVGEGIDECAQGGDPAAASEFGNTAAPTLAQTPSRIGSSAQYTPELQRQRQELDLVEAQHLIEVYRTNEKRHNTIRLAEDEAVLRAQAEAAQRASQQPTRRLGIVKGGARGSPALSRLESQRWNNLGGNWQNTKLQEVVSGLTNNTVKVPQMYFKQSRDERLKKKAELLDQLSKIFTDRGEDSPMR